MVQRIREQARSHIRSRLHAKRRVRRSPDVGAGLLAKRPVEATRQADLARINPLSLAASNRIATNFDVGVWLPSPVLSSGTSGLTSG